MEEQEIGEFIAQYIQKSVSDGVCKPSDIRTKAFSDIKNIDDKIKKIELLKNKQTKLRAVIKHLGGAGKSKSFNKTIDFSISEDKLPPFFKDIMYFICESIEKNNSITNSEVLGCFGIENNKTVYSVIKWLGAREIISKNDLDMVKGKNWDTRPKRG